MKKNSKVKFQKSKVMRLTACVFVLMFLFLPILADVNTNAGIIFPELINGAGPRAAAMAGAYTAVADDASAVFCNPAGLAQVKKISLALSYDSWFVDSFFSNLSGAIPLSAGTLGAEVFYMNFGSFRMSDDYGYESGSISPFSLYAALAYGINLTENFSAGATAKFIVQSRGTESSTGISGDLGLMYKTGLLSAGIAAKNLGTAAGAQLPIDIRLGLAVKPDAALVIAVDADYILGDALYAAAGAEYTIEKMFSIRAGYKYRAAESGLQGISGISAGLGVKLGSIGFDYAFVPYGELGASHRAALNLEFGAMTSKPEIIKEKEPETKKEKPADNSQEFTKDEEKLYKMFFEAGALESAGKLAAAGEVYRQMIKADKTYAPAYKRLGAVMVKLKRKKEAVWCFEEYLKLKPDDNDVAGWLKKNRQ